MSIENSTPSHEASLHPETGVSKEDARKHFLANTVSNILFFVFNTVTSFFMVPYQVANLGIGNYGVITLASSVVSYTLILTSVLTSTVFRFVTERLAVDDIDGAHAYYNTQTIVFVWFSVIFLPIICLISYLTPSMFRIPLGQENNTRWLFFMVYLSFLLTLLSNPPSILQFVKQRFDIRNYIEIASQIVRYSTWIIIFALVSPNIWHIGLGFALAALVKLIITVATSKRLMPEFGFRMHGFDFRKFIEMAKMGSWVAVTQVGFILYMSVDLLIINTMIGPSSGGKYSTILGLAFMLRGLSSTMTGMITPVVIASYARKETESLVINLSRSVKFVSIGMALPMGILCGLAMPFLTWWLGPKFASLYPLVWLILAHHIINCGVQPLFNVNVAANRTALPGIATLIGGLVKLGFTFILLRYTGLGLYAVAIAGIVGFALNNWLFTPIYAAKILKVSSWPFYKALLPSVLVFGVTSGAALLLTRSFNLAAFIPLAIATMLIFAVIGAGVYFALLDGADRAFLARLIPGKHRKTAEG